MSEVFIVSAKRTPIGRFLGGFTDLTAVDLGSVAAKSAILASGIPAESIDTAIFGTARQAGLGPNPARQVAWRAGARCPAMTINMACASGLQAVALGAQAIRAGEAEVALVGGMESMSRVPHLLPRAREGYRLGHVEVVDAMYKDGFLCPICDLIMGEAVDRQASSEGFTRAASDVYAAESQRRAEVARKDGRFQSEIAPVEVPGKKGPTIVSSDEHPRDGVTPAQLAKLPAVFSKGIVSAGNASGITDGAAALVLASAAKVKELGLSPIAKLGHSTTASVHPAEFAIGPVPAIERLLARVGRGIADYDLVELNEAFAAQILLCQKRLPIQQQLLNVNGGAIALGHPIGATGARILTTLVHEMARRQAGRGLAALCVSGGMGIALEVERP